MKTSADIFNRLQDIHKMAKAKGADHVVATYSTAEQRKVSVSRDDIERIEQPENSVFEVAVYLGQKTGSVSINSARPEILEQCIDQAIFNAKMQPDDKFVQLLDPSELPKTYAKLDSVDPVAPSMEELVERAKTASVAALNGHSKIVHAEGAASWSKSAEYILSSNGFQAIEESTGHSTQASAVGLENGQQQLNYDYDAQVYGEDLKSSAEIGRIAAEKTVASLSPRSIQAQTAPIIFDPRVSGSLISHFVRAMSGAAVLRSESFLINKLDKQVFAPNISIIEDPLLPRGLGAYAFDAEGIAAQKHIFVENGHLKMWLFGSYSARKFNDHFGTNYKTTGHVGVNPYYYMSGGTQSPEDMIAEVQNGFYITNLMNLKVNAFDGTFTSPASGFWIENGKIAYPVEGASVGGNLLDVFARLEAANNVDRRGHIHIPTLRVDQFKIG